MNREEANKYGTEWLKDEYLDAKDRAFIMRALEALNREPSSDMISRQEVLNEIPVLWNSNGDKDYCMESLRDFVAELPPVADIKKEKNVEITPSEQEPSNDLISKQAVLALKQTFYDNAGYETEYVDVEDIEALSPIQRIVKNREFLQNFVTPEHMDFEHKTDRQKGVNELSMWDFLTKKLNMSTKKASLIINSPWSDATQYYLDLYNKYNKALSLEQAEDKKQEPSGDLISRQAVDKLSQELVHTTRDKADFLCNFWEGLRKLPPVTPEHIEFEHKADVVIAQLREDRDKLLDIIAQITEEINTPNRGTCDYAIVDNIEEILNDYKALDKDDAIEDLEI